MRREIPEGVRVEIDRARRALDRAKALPVRKPKPGEPVSSTERPPNNVLPPSEPEQGAWDVDGPETV